MTRRLILIRHAKSIWDDSPIPDPERPLNACGRAAARDIGRWLASRGYLPDEVLCSSALRTRETWDVLAPALPEAPEPQYSPTLYHASAEVMLAVLRYAKGNLVLMLGHNPGIAGFAHRLVTRAPLHSSFQRYPTATTLVAEFRIEDWVAADFGQAAADDFITPKDIQP